MSATQWRPAVAIILVLVAGVAARDVRTRATDATAVNWDPARAQAVPQRIGEWAMVAEAPPDERALREFQRLASVERVYARSSDGARVMVWLVYGLTMQAMHFPERCLRAGGWNMTAMHSVVLPMGDGSTISEATVISSERPPGRRLQQVYLFADSEGTSADWLSLVWRRGRSGVMQRVLCMVIAARELKPDEDSDQSLSELTAFLVGLLPSVRDSLATSDPPATP